MNRVQMTSRSAETILRHLRELDAGTRSAYLAHQIDDPASRTLVERALDAPTLDDFLQTGGGLEGALFDNLKRTLAAVSLLEPGERIGAYEIREMIGAGGLGQVYRAYDAALDREVAIKALNERQHDSAGLERFQREARILAALDHPNIVTIHALEQQDGRGYLVMELVDGSTAGDAISGRGMEVSRFFELAAGLLDALEAAHENGVIHRDLKPANVMITRSGQVKVLDFGIAKHLGTEPSPAGTLEQQTAEGTILGTVPYMSPEQLRGDPVDYRSDLFSTGVLLYEAATGRHPFERSSNAELVAAILRESPKPVSEQGSELPVEIDRILHECLAKSPDDRPASARAVREMLADVRQHILPQAPDSDPNRRRQSDSEPHPTLALPPESSVHADGRRLGPSKFLAALAALLVLMGIAFYVPYRSQREERRARALIPEIQSLLSAGNFAQAYDNAIQVEEDLGEDPVLERLMPEISDHVTITTDPPGADVYLQPFSGELPARVHIGVTPIVDHRIPRLDHLASIEKPGFSPLERVVSSTWNRAEERFGVARQIVIDEVLLPEEEVPPGMVAIQGGEYRLRGSGFGGMAAVTLDDFFIDRYEVSNEQYREFIRSGGYTNHAYWRHPFMKDGDELSFDEAVGHFTDQTGLPGPREWKGQDFVAGRERHPVTGISWYEAAAYAEYAGKALPTVYQWEKAARNGRYTRFEGTVMPWGLVNSNATSERHANFFGRDTTPVDSYPFGVSPYGAYHMAGNVQEWCLNERGEGRATTGGSWADTIYSFQWGEARPPFDASSSIGVRCVSKPREGAPDQGTHRVEAQRTIFEIEPVDDATYRSFASHYRYENEIDGVEIIERIDLPDWTREKLTFAGAAVEGDDPAIAYLYLPRNVEPPFQCIHYVASGTVLRGRTVAAEVEALLSPQIKSGRAVMAVVPPAALERTGSLPPLEERTLLWRRSFSLAYIAEFRRGLDYLDSRDDIDMQRISQVGFSWGAERSALILIAVEPRISSAILIGAELDPRGTLPEVNPMNFVPRIEVPVMVLNGRYDEEAPYEPNGRALFELLPEPKRLELVESGHLPPIEIRTPIINEFLDETLGPVARGSR